MNNAEKNCVALVRKHEGGYNRDYHDPGNWTSGQVGIGILRGTNGGIAASAHPELDIANLTSEKIDEIYVTEYCPLYHVNEIPLALAMAALDAGVMSGAGDRKHERAIGWLQEAVGATPDGSFGPRTLAACHDVTDLRQAVNALCDKRLCFLRELRLWKRDGNGWSARVADTRRAALLCI